MDINTIKVFIKDNKWPVLMGLFVYGLFYFLLFPETGFAIVYQQKNTVQIITADTLESPVFTINKTKNMEHILVKGIINSHFFRSRNICFDYWLSDT
ncbi:hypothetical protein H9W95_03305 [Flavobacterium lindanitolerans]|nr:hypothetical protein [Flavobacterium lindanitolerans]